MAQPGKAINSVAKLAYNMPWWNHDIGINKHWNAENGSRGYLFPCIVSYDSQTKFVQ